LEVIERGVFLYYGLDFQSFEGTDQSKLAPLRYYATMGPSSPKKGGSIGSTQVNKTIFGSGGLPMLDTTP